MEYGRPEAFERAFQRNLLKFVGLPYVYGGRGYGGVDCSSLIVRSIRATLRLHVRDLRWMTADQLARGHALATIPTAPREAGASCTLVFFDWDEDAIYEHVAVRLLDGTWIWSSSSAGMVVNVDPASEGVYRRQWREIEGALDGRLSLSRCVNWSQLRACQ